MRSLFALSVKCGTSSLVKREKGFNPATHDWEFFELDVSRDGSKIRTRGFADVNNRFGGNCFGCHVAAHPEWDFVCDTTQRTDPRCKNQAPVSAEDAAALAQLSEILKTQMEAKPSKQ